MMYTGLRTCNIWVSDAFKKAQIPTAVWSPHVTGIMYHAKKRYGNLQKVNAG